MKRKKILDIIQKIITVLNIILFLVAPWLVLTAMWVISTWPLMSMEELICHIRAPLVGTNFEIISDYLINTVLPAAVIFAVCLTVFILIRKKKFYKIVNLILFVAFSALALYAVLGTLKYYGIINYIRYQKTYSTFIDDNYVDPGAVDIEFPEQKRNVIYIFLESMEITYSDTENGGYFEESRIPELTQLALDGEDFSGADDTLNGAHPLTGATWTMGAIFAQTSGLPLNIPIEINSMDTQYTFFEDAVTFGDILQDAGYSQTFLIGSDATFGGRRLYFSSPRRLRIHGLSVCHRKWSDTRRLRGLVGLRG